MPDQSQSVLTAPDSDAQRQPGEQRLLRHMTQLDPLRAFAVIAVMIQHWGQAPGTRFPLGTLGVRLFFVLSGFLITGILLQCRQFSITTGQSVWFTARQFYIRRFLRIFPLFYFVILLTYLLNVRTVRETAIWHAFYLSNFYAILNPDKTGPTSHFWSLAVEEQFYLVWPWVILLLPDRYLLKAIVLTVMIAPLSRLAIYLAGYHPLAASYAPYACLDTLGMGALLAALRDRQFNVAPEKLERILRSFLIAGLVLFAAALTARFSRTAKVVDVVAFNLSLGLMFTWLIGRAAQGFKGPAGVLLTFRPLVFIGMISYGVYVYHNFLPPLVLGFKYKLPRPVREVPLVLLAFVIPIISWYVLERPLNSLKRHFKYRKPDSAGIAYARPVEA